VGAQASSANIVTEQPVEPEDTVTIEVDSSQVTDGNDLYVGFDDDGDDIIQKDEIVDVVSSTAGETQSIEFTPSDAAEVDITTAVTETVAVFEDTDTDVSDGDTESADFPQDPDSVEASAELEITPTADGELVVNDDESAEYTTISDAVSAADSGDTITVKSGDYGEVTIDVEGLTLEGPNAGLAGDSDQRGSEASFQTGGSIDADDVTIDGFELVPGPVAGSGESRTEIFGANTEIVNSDVNVPDGDASFRLRDGADNTVFTQNRFAGGDGEGGNFVINARQDFTQLIDGVEITDNTFEDSTGTGTTVIQAAGFTNADISGNSFDNIGEDAVRLAGDVSGTEVTNNEFSNYAQNSGFAAGAIVANDASGDNVDVSGNQFNDAGGDERYIAAYSRNDPVALDLGTIASNNNFDTAVVAGDTFIVPDAGQDEVVNINTGERFDSDTAIQDAVDNANSDNTLRVGSGTYEESVTISGTDNLTLQGSDDANGNSPVIVGDGNTMGSQPHAAIEIDGNGPTQNTTIEGFTIRNPDGHYGVYAGTGGSNSDVDGFILRNNVIEDVATNLDSHNPLAGTVSGLYVRAQYDSISVTDNVIRNVDTEGDQSQNAVGLSFSSFIGDEAFEDAGNLDSRSGTDTTSETAENTVVINNTVTNITGAADSRTKGISASGEFDGVTIENNTISDINETGNSGNAFGISLTENPGGTGTDIDGDGTNERIGPRNFAVKNNDINSISSGDEGLLFVGGYEELGPNHIVEDNNFIDTGAGVARFADNQEGFNPGDEDTLDATSNWWGDASGPSGARSGSGATVSENVDFEPWLDAAAPDGEAVSRQGLAVEIADPAIGTDETTEITSVEEVLSNGQTRRDLTDEATFESADSDIASVDSEGTITAESPGSTTITASADGLTGEVDVRVGLVEAIEVTVEDDRIPVDGSTGFTVEATFTDGSVSEVTDNGDIAFGFTTGEDRATLDTDANTVTGDTQGTVTLEATLQGETDTAELDVFREETETVQNNRVEFNEVESTRSIDFDEDVDGDVSVSEGTQPPEDSPDPPADVDPIVAPDYEVPDDATDTSARIELEISAERLAEVGLDGLDADALEDRLRALREADNGYDVVTIVDVAVADDGTATVTIRTPGFSTFILGGTSPSTGSSGGGGGGGGGGGVTAGSTGASVTSGQATTVRDSRPTESGTTVTFSQTALTAITFESGDVRGTAGVDQLDRVPSSGPPFNPNRPVAAVLEIEVPDEQADRPATLEIELTTGEFDDAGFAPEDATVLRALDEEYESLDTEAEIDGDTVTITTETPGFSTFVVTESTDDAGTETPEPERTPDADDSEPTTETPDTDRTPEPATETPEPESLPGFGPVVALAALLGAALLAARRHDEG
jgi:PGF-CTERM protein